MSSRDYCTGYLQVLPSGYTTSASSTLKEQETEENFTLSVIVLQLTFMMEVGISIA